MSVGVMKDYKLKRRDLRPLNFNAAMTFPRHEGLLLEELFIETISM